MKYRPGSENSAASRQKNNYINRNTQYLISLADDFKIKIIMLNFYCPEWKYFPRLTIQKIPKKEFTGFGKSRAILIRTTCPFDKLRASP
jgi:hypothetical protein